MNAPPEVAVILLQILRKGLLQIRQQGWGGDSASAAELADHLHDVPAMLSDYHDWWLTFYWQTMKPSLEQTPLGGLFAEEWKRLQPHAEKAQRSEALHQVSAS